VRDTLLRVTWPRTEDLAFDPELASLAMLDAALAAAVQALLARNPELLCGDAAFHRTPSASAVHRIVRLHREMHDALDAYRELLPSVRDLQRELDDIPF
jgi:hypothetical protein